jgi:hypothetical protein
VQDRDGARLVLRGLQRGFPRLRQRWADQASTGPILDWIKQQVGWTVEVVERSPRRGLVVTVDGEFQRVRLPAVFEPLPRRWVVERTQPQCLQSALDVQTTGSHDRTRWAAELAHRRQPATGRSAGLSMCSSGSWCAMSVVPSESAPRASAPPRARALSYAVGGSSCRRPIGNDSCTCSVASSNGS